MMTWAEYAGLAAVGNGPITDLDRVTFGQSTREDVLRDPILKEYNRNPPSRLRTVADVLGNRMRWVDDLTDPRVPVAGPEGHDPLPWPFRNSVATQVMFAIPYLWTDYASALAEDMKLPHHVVSQDVMPFPIMWWAVEQVVAEHEDQWRASAVSVKHEQPGIQVMMFMIRASSPGAARVDGFSIGYGARYPDDFPDADTRHAAGLVLSRLSFLNSPYIPVTERHLERHDVRSRSRVGIETTPDDSVRFVDLRAALQQERTPADATDSGGRYRVRWIVRGHHRAQWYPSLNAHKVIWVAPYMKGDPDAPVKTTAYRVMR